MSSVKELAEVMSVDLFVVLIDTGVSVITSGPGIMAGALELDTPSWKDYNVAVSTAGIVLLSSSVLQDAVKITNAKSDSFKKFVFMVKCLK